MEFKHLLELVGADPVFETALLLAGRNANRGELAGAGARTAALAGLECHPGRYTLSTDGERMWVEVDREVEMRYEDGIRAPGS